MIGTLALIVGGTVFGAGITSFFRRRHELGREAEVFTLGATALGPRYRIVFNGGPKNGDHTSMPVSVWPPPEQVDRYRLVDSVCVQAASVEGWFPAVAVYEWEDPK